MSHWVGRETQSINATNSTMCALHVDNESVSQSVSGPSLSEWVHYITAVVVGTAAGSSLFTSASLINSKWPSTWRLVHWLSVDGWSIYIWYSTVNTRPVPLSQLGLPPTVQVSLCTTILTLAWRIPSPGFTWNFLGFTASVQFNRFWSCFAAQTADTRCVASE